MEFSRAEWISILAVVVSAISLYFASKLARNSERNAKAAEESIRHSRQTMENERRDRRNQYMASIVEETLRALDFRGPGGGTEGALDVLRKHWVNGQVLWKDFNEEGLRDVTRRVMRARGKKNPEEKIEEWVRAIVG